MSLTPLQQAIKDAIDQHPNQDDEWIARYVYSQQTGEPMETWEGRGPSTTYVAERRRKEEADAQPPIVEVEMPSFLFEPEQETDEDEDYDPLAYIEELDEEEPAEPEKPVTRAMADTMYTVTEDDALTLIGLPFNKLAKYTGYDGWRLDPRDPDDAKFIQLSHKMGHKYLPDVLANYGLEIMWTITALGFFGDRIVGYRQYRADKAGTIEQQLRKEEPQPEPEPEPETPQEETGEQEGPALPHVEGLIARGQDEFLRRQRS